MSGWTEEPVEQKAEVENEQPEGEGAASEEGGEKAEGEEQPEGTDEGGEAEGGEQGDGDEPLISESEAQARIGRVAKGIRESQRSKIDARDQRISDLEAENQRLKSQGDQSQGWDDDSDSDTTPKPKTQPDAGASEVDLKIQEAFLKREFAKAYRQHGEAWNNACLLVEQDPALVAKIQWADDPAKMVMEEAEHIAEEQELGGDRKAREEKKIQERVAAERKKWEAEMAEKFKARNNQPTDLGTVRVAGGNEVPKSVQESWTTGKNPLPK